MSNEVVLCVTRCNSDSNLVEYRDVIREISIMTGVTHSTSAVKNIDGSYTVTVSAETHLVNNDQYLSNLASAMSEIEFRLYNETNIVDSKTTFILV